MTSQPPPPTVSSTPFIAAIIVMLAAIGGLVLWKTSGKQAAPTEAAEAPSAAPAAAEAAPVLEDPAPPPPAADEPEAPAAALGKAPRKVASAAPIAAGPCGADCAGTSTPTLERQLAGLGRTARRCYDQALEKNPELKGRIMVSVRVGPTGQVCGASIASNGTGDAALGACVAQKYRTAQLSAPQGGCVDVQVPLNFIPDNAR